MKSQRLLLAVLASAALVALLVLALFLREGHRARADDTSMTGAGSAASSATAVLAAEHDVQTREGHDVRAPIGFSQDSTSESVLGGIHGPTLVLLEKTERRPLPGARVWVWTPGTAEAELAYGSENWIGSDHESAIVARGRALTANERGEVTLPVTRSMSLVVARADDLYGLMQTAPEAEGLQEMLLSRQHEILARVVDERGVPQPKIEVGLAYCGDTDSFWQAVTDERGEVRCRNLESLLEACGADFESPFAVRVDIPADSPIEEWVALDRVPNEPIVLTLPATGSLTVTVVDEAHQRVPVSGLLRVQTTGRSLVARARTADEVGAVLPLVNGIGKAPRIPLNLELSVNADLDGTGEGWIQVKGPTTPGEEVSIEVAFPDDHTLLSGRIVDENGKPMAKAQFDWLRVVEDGSKILASGRNVLVTGPEGRFTWTLRRTTNVQKSTGTLRRHGFLCEIAESSRRRSAQIDFQTEVRTGLLDLGDVRVAPREPLVSGRVVAAADQGVPGKSVALFIRSTDGAITNSPIHDACITASDGSFAIFGPCLPLPFQARVIRPDHIDSDAVEIRCTGAGTKIELHYPVLGSIVGTGLVDRDWSGENLWVRYDPEGAKDPSQVGDLWRAGDRVYFVIQSPNSGRGAVSFIHSEAEDVPIVVIEAVEVIVGACTRDPRLQDVDLRGKLPKAGPAEVKPNQLELEIVDARGRSIRSGFVWIWEDSLEDAEELLFAGGRVRLPVTEARAIEIWAQGHRSKFVAPPHRSARVVLPPELEVTLVFPLPPELRDGRFTITGSVWLEEETAVAGRPPCPALDRMSGFRLDSAGHAQLRLPCAGTFAVGIALSGKIVGGEDEIEEYDVQLTSPRLTVRDTDGEQRFEFAPDADALKQCLEDIGLAPRPR